MKIQTERTIIKKITKADAPFIKELVNTPGWLKFIGDRNIHSIKDAEEYIAKTCFTSEERYGFTYYLFKSKNNDPIGISGFLKKDYLEFPDFGFAIMPEYHQKGFGYEAGSAILNYGISEFKLSIVDAITMLTNDASMNLLKKLGFLEHGTITVPDTGEIMNLFRLKS